MRIFKENQRFDQWWLVLIAFLFFAGWIILIFYRIEASGTLEDIFSVLIIGSLTMILISGIFLVRLETIIDTNGITAKFSPFKVFRKHFYWKDIRKVYVRKYSPILEYGGWGIKGRGASKAYNVSGKYGIQIITHNNKKFLIGTSKPEMAERFLKKLKENNTSFSNI